MRRPIDRKRQPVPRVMPSSTKPDSVVIEVTARSSQASACGSDGAGAGGRSASAVSWLSERQWSLDIRSRRLNATRARAPQFLAQPCSACVAARSRSAPGWRRRSEQALARRQHEGRRDPVAGLRGVALHAGDRHPQQARGGVATLAVAAEPEQVLGRARRNVAARRDQVALGDRRRQQRERSVHRPRDSTQVSFDRPPCCIAMTRESSSPATRVRPPGITR